MCYQSNEFFPSVILNSSVILFVSFAPKIIILVSFVIRKVVKSKMPHEEKNEKYILLSY